MVFNSLRRKLPNSTITVDGNPFTQSGYFAPGPQHKWYRFQGTEKGRKYDFRVLFGPKSYLSEYGTNDSIRNLFTSLTGDADVIAYAGHADSGENIAILSQWIKFVPSHYTLMYINSCWSLTHILDPRSSRTTDTMLEKVRRINDGRPASKFVDFILNVNPSNMYKMSQSMTAILMGIMNEKTYGEILADMSSSGTPVVVNEEDNPPNGMLGKWCKIGSPDGTANVRSAANGTAEVIKVLNNGASVKTTAVNGGWMAVEFKLGGVEYGNAHNKPAFIHLNLLNCDQ